MTANHHEESKLDLFTRSEPSNLNEFVGIRVPLDMSNRIEALIKDWKLKTKTEAYLHMISLGLKVYEMKERLREPELVARVKHEITRTSLVDWVETIDDNQVDILLFVLKNEREQRFRK